MMNIKALRKDYQNLTMFQRLALLDNAISRNDDSEAEAIVAASPRKTFSQTDYCELFEQIAKIRLFNLIFRLGYIMSFDFLLIGQLDRLINKSSLKAVKRIDDDLRLGAFLYVRATDSWDAVNKELGLRPNFDEEIGEHLFAIDLMRSKDQTMRAIAFSEDEAKAFVRKRTGIDEFRTMEKEIEAYREFLELDKL